nr:MAG TPA: hypothetical protein [Caudoviricetes sp.]
MSWLAWQGMQAGLDYDHAWLLPWGEVMDYIAIKQIMSGEAKQKRREKDFWELMEYK